jgi:3-hydroxybutyryl-CoA dehydrogenase
MSNQVNTIVVCGAGTMGSGIAQVAAQSGFHTVLYDLNQDILSKAKDSIDKSLTSLVEKNKLQVVEKGNILNQIHFATDLNYCIGELIIEAIAEKVEVKSGLFNQLAEINHSETIFATNTSSLSVTSIASRVMHPERVCGMHFFNPAPIMKLVEVVKADQSRQEVIQSVMDIASQMGKTPVLCKDAPGFIVNRIARHYYLEALKMLESGKSSIEQIDNLMLGAGFKMGPFRLMDLIGNDVNFAVTKSLYEAFDKTIRFRPSYIQEEKVSKGELGKKSGKGYYQYP